VLHATHNPHQSLAKCPAKSLLLITRQREPRAGHIIIHNDVIHFPRTPRRCFPSFALFLRLSISLSSRSPATMSLILSIRPASPSVKLRAFRSPSMLSGFSPPRLLSSPDTTLVIALTCKYSLAKASKITECVSMRI